MSRRKKLSNARINDKDYCLKVYNFSFNQAELELPMSKILYNTIMFDDDVYQDIWRDLFTKKLYEILDRNIEALDMIPCPDEPSWQDWIEEDKLKAFVESGEGIDYFGRMFVLAMRDL